MPLPRQELPIEVRRACWDRLWQILLSEPRTDDVKPLDSEPGSEPAGIDDEAAQAVPRRQLGR